MVMLNPSNFGVFCYRAMNNQNSLWVQTANVCNSSFQPKSNKKVNIVIRKKITLRLISVRLFSTTNTLIH